MVATSVAPRKMYQDYLETPDDGQRYELIDGEIIVSPSPILLHQRTVKVLSRLLDDFVVPRRLGEVVLSPIDVRLAANIVVQPDIAFVRRGSAADNPAEARIAGSPELMIEVLSLSNPGHDLVRKRELYARYGVLEYWIVDPIRRTIVALTLVDGQYAEILQGNESFDSAALTGLTVDVPAFFVSAFQ